MQVHVPTLLAVLLVGYLLLAVELTLARWRRPPQPELDRWMVACWAIAGSFATAALRPWLPPTLALVASNGLTLLGLALFYQSFHLLLKGQPAPRWPLWVQPLLWTLLAGTPLLAAGGRIAANAAAMAVFFLSSLWLVLTHPRDGQGLEPPLRGVALMLAIGAIALLHRMLDALMQPHLYVEGSLGPPGQGVVVMMIGLSMLGTGFGFVLAAYERVAERMEDLASRDAMTGCLNRATTDALLAHSLTRARRDGSALTFAIVDLDRFKQINDRHGHPVGDEVLRQFAATVRHRLRSSDVFGRLGGEEFGMVLPRTDSDGARRLLEAMRAAVGAVAIDDGRGGTVRVTFSAGMATALPERTEVTALDLFERADRALYHAKHGGRNRVHVDDGSDDPLTRPPFAVSSLFGLSPAAAASAARGQRRRPDGVDGPDGSDVRTTTIPDPSGSGPGRQGPGTSPS